MKNIFLFLFLMITIPANAQNDFDKIIDKETGATIFKGRFNIEAIEKQPDFTWFAKGVEAYKPDEGTLQTLKLKDYDIVVLMGTWCEDSQILVPKLYKALRMINYPFTHLQIVGVDRAKEGKYKEKAFYNLEFVPTIILFKEGKEVGRIVETVNESIEKDLLKLTNN